MLFQFSKTYFLNILLFIFIYLYVIIIIIIIYYCVQICLLVLHSDFTPKFCANIIFNDMHILMQIKLN